MLKRSYTIWSYEDGYSEDMRNFVEEVYPGLSEYEIENEAFEMNMQYLEDERENLGGLMTEGKLIVIADLGLWDGRHFAYDFIESRRISDCLVSYYEPTWYVDGTGEFICKDVHHDGINFYAYREIKPNLSEEQIDEFLDRLADGNCSEEYIDNYTNKLGHRIAEVYGWN